MDTIKAAFCAVMLAVLLAGFAPDSDPPECATPIPNGAPSTVYHAEAQFQNHVIYWPCVDCTTNPAQLAPNELQFEVDALAWYWDTQDFLLALPKNQPGDGYCIHFAPLGTFDPPVYLLWPVPLPHEGCAAPLTADMTLAQFAWVEGGSNELDCALALLRTKGL